MRTQSAQKHAPSAVQRFPLERRPNTGRVRIPPFAQAALPSIGKGGCPAAHGYGKARIPGLREKPLIPIQNNNDSSRWVLLRGQGWFPLRGNQVASRPGDSNRFESLAPCHLSLNAALHFTPKAYPEGPPRVGSLFRIKNPSLLEIMNFFTLYDRKVRFGAVKAPTAYRASARSDSRNSKDTASS